MSEWEIIHTDGGILKDENGNEVTVKSLEYNGSWMGECFVTVSFKSPAPISFKIGDYLTYRGEVFEINYDPGKIKQSRRNEYGEAFIYENVKFNAKQDELARTEFLDIVLHDNQIHYTSLTKFSFYVSSLDDLLDRIQANLNEQWGSGAWKLYSRNRLRSGQRGCDLSVWDKVYGSGIADNVIDSTSITADGLNCWSALALINSQFDINFITRGRNVFVGTAGLPTSHIFKYGKGKGLYQIEQNADSEQAITTRLRAYGSSKNLPNRYYATLNLQTFARVVSIDSKGMSKGNYNVYAQLDLPFSISYFYNPLYDFKDGRKSYLVTLMCGGQKVQASVFKTKGATTTSFFAAHNNTADFASHKNSLDDIRKFGDAVKIGEKIIFLFGVKKESFPKDYKSYATDNLPNNMAIDRLMLPGFPNKSLKQWWSEQSEETKQRIYKGDKVHLFSENKYRPYIDSANVREIGVRPNSVYFDNKDIQQGIEDIYPTIEKMEINGIRIDEVKSADTVEDNGVFKDGSTIPNFHIYLKAAIDFDINDLIGNSTEQPTISMKDGMCAGRTFQIGAVSKQNDGSWELTCQRVKDESLNLYFPYNDYQIKTGDHFVLLGIPLPDSYVEAASVRLLKYALAFLDKNDYTRYVYSPKVDEVYMQRQHDLATADVTGSIVSLHDTIKEGDVMQFEDADLRVEGKVSIDQLTIRETDVKIPTYEITLREDKSVGTIQKLQEKINSIESGNSGVMAGGGGNNLTVPQIQRLIEAQGEKRFLSKLTPDTAQELITFLKGVAFGGGAAIDGEGRAELISVILDTIKSYNFDSTTESGFGITKRKNGKYQLSITDLIVWGKAIFNELEIRKMSYVGGNMVFSSCGSKIKAVVPISADGQEIVEKSHSFLKAHNKTITANGQILYYTRAKKRSANVKIAAYRCYFYQDDSTTATTNLWEAGDQARCQTFNIKDGVYQGVSNRKYWRLVKNVGNDYIDLSVDDCEEGSDIPQVGDSLVQFGSRTNTDRMSLIYVVVNGDDAPAIIWYDKVNSYTLEGKKTAIISPKEVTFHTRMFNLLNDDGTTESISSIKQTTENIQLEVRRQTFGGANLLKGASLRPLNLLSLQRAQYVTIVKYPSVAHFDNPYLSISRHGATQDEWNGCKFPIVTIQSGKTYTLSMFVRIYGSDQPYIEIKRSKSKDMSAPKTSYPNIPLSYGVWKQYSYSFDMEDGYNYLQIFIGCTRNGEAYISEIQLEEGTKATTWKDPDVIESIKRAGVNITLGRIEARADNFVIRNSEGKLTTVIDENGQLIAGSLRTQDRGNGYMTLEGNQQSFFKHGIPHPMRWIGYTSEGWVERMYDDVGNLIWENGVNGQIFKMRPERWEDIASHVIVHGISTLDYFFNIYGANALSKIFQSNKDEQYNVYKYHAARDVRGNIIATSQTNPIQSVRDSDGVLFSQKDIKGTKFSGIIRTNIITLCTINYRSNNSSTTIEEDQEERQKLEISADFIRSRIEELRKKFSLYNTYNVEVRIGVPLYCTQIAVYKDGILTGDYYLYANEKDVNKNNLNM